MKMKIRRLISLALVSALVIMLFAGCGGNQAPETTSPATPGTSAPAPASPSLSPTPPPYIAPEAADKVVESITYGLRNISWDLSPWKNNGSTGNTVFPQLYSGLLANPTFGTALADMHYDMAESIDFSADRMTATVKLRDYIHDSKGNPIKAEDVVFAYQTAPKVAGVYASIGSQLASIRAVNDFTVELKLTRMAPGIWESLLSFCPVVSKSWYENASDEEKANDPATTSAYRVLENVPGTSITLEALDDFWQKDDLRSVYQIVNVRIINCVAVVEDNMRLVALENGEIDTGYIENSSVPRYAKDPNFNIYPCIKFNPSVVGINCSENSPFYNNPALRKAVLHAIDFEQVAIACSGEFTFPSHDLAPTICGNYDPAWDDQPYFDYDLDIARQYLTEAGYSENSGLTIRFMLRNAGGQMPAVSVMQSNLADVGINLIMNDYDQALYDTYLPDPTQWDMVWLGASMTTGFVTEAWDWYLGSRGEQRTVGFIKDDTLQRLLDTAIEKNDSASLNTFRDYVLDQGYAANLFMEIGHQIGRKGIPNVPFSFLGNVILNASTFTDDYVPAAWR